MHSARHGRNAYEGLYNEEDNHACHANGCRNVFELVQIYSPSGGEKEQSQWLMNYFKERGIEAP